MISLHWMLTMKNEIYDWLEYNKKMTSDAAIMLFDLSRALNLSAIIVNLNYCMNIDDKYIKSLGEYSKYDTFLTLVDLSGINVSDTSTKTCISYLDGNTMLNYFRINSNVGIPDKSISYLKKIIESSHIIHGSIFIHSLTKLVLLIYHWLIT